MWKIKANPMKINAAIFDLDGVLVDSAKYHYLAWKQLALDLGFDFPQGENEKLKGVSRMQSLELLLECGNMQGRFSMPQKIELASRKNELYLAYINRLDKDEILPGAAECLMQFRSLGIKTALGSASKNAGIILDRLDLRPLFDAIVDGNRTSRAKPDPEVFLLGARDLGADPISCLVFEDAQAGLDAAKAGGMRAVAVGRAADLHGYDAIFSGLHEVDAADLLHRFA
jgi:beta-phosphoglucomutase